MNNNNSGKRPIRLEILIVAILAAISLAASPSFLNPSSYAWTDPNPNPRGEKAPVVVSGKNIYVVWGTDKGTQNNNGELMFMVSTDSGKTFSNKINLSNSPNADAIDQMIDVDEDLIAVTWWEHNQTSNIPVMRISTDNGKSFGDLIMLSAK